MCVLWLCVCAGHEKYFRTTAYGLTGGEARGLKGALATRPGSLLLLFAAVAAGYFLAVLSVVLLQQQTWLGVLCCAGMYTHVAPPPQEGGGCILICWCMSSDRFVVMHTAAVQVTFLTTRA